MGPSQRLRNNRDALLEQYKEHIGSIHDLQDILIQNVLPSLCDELALTPEASDWAKEWLSDTGSIFRICRRNKFTRSFSLEAIQKSLKWRLENLWPPRCPTRIPNFYCLPPSVRDPFGRPILVVRVMAAQDSESFRSLVIEIFERLRLFLKQLYDETAGVVPALQLVVLLDLGELSLRVMNLDLLSWVSREVVPHFPGMIAAVFMLNYSWAHAGIWNIVKPLLPESALSRVFFTTKQELLVYLTPEAVPQEFGGSLPPLAHEDPLNPPTSNLQLVPELTNISDTVRLSEPPQWMPSMSALNPFFGYPIQTSSTRGGPTLRYGRRRKRDLLRTLLKLFWLRWRRQLTIGCRLATLIIVVKYVVGHGLLRFLRRISRFRLYSSRL